MKTKKLKKYQKPHTECFPAIIQCHIMEWSAYKGEGGTNIPEARQYDMPEEEEEESFGYKRYNLWSN